MSQYDAREVADLLSRFDFKILREQEGDFSPSHRKYLCEFSRPGYETFSTSYQCNPEVHGQPTAADVFAALVSDALAVDGYNIDDFADELGFDKPSAAIRAYEACKKTLDWFKDSLSLYPSALSAISETLDENMDEIKESVTRAQAERDAKHAFEHPVVPEGFSTIEQLQEGLDIGDYGDQITEYDGDISDAIAEVADSNVDLYNHDLLKWLPDNYEWIEEAYAQGLLEGCKGDLMKMTQMAQYECFSQDMYDHLEDIAKYAALEGLKDAGVYALSDEVFDEVFFDSGIEFNDNNQRVEALVDEVKDAIQEHIKAGIADAIGDEDMAEDIMDEYDAVGNEHNVFDTVNPCAMSVEMVRTVNEKGFDTAFKDFTEACRSAAKDAPTLSDAAKECRVASGKLEDHDEQAPEHANEHDAGNEEH